ncbi:MAG: hypothetical protein GF393_05610 [Armatimonadia bacterium]|nr:hypothetical protein [Armatimonadia bacterium]
MRKLLAVVLGASVGLGVLGAGAWVFAREEVDDLRLRATRHVAPQTFERQARALFEQRYPGEKPLNWAIAETAERFHDEQPMGRFVLHGNDCSDFVGCAIDEALGAGARFNRNSDEHALCGEGGAAPRWLFDYHLLPAMSAVQPGDIVRVRHSPWYPPNDDSCGHIGLVGPDGRVIDFSKLKSWPRARYNQVDFEFFIQHNEPDEVTIGRLRPEFRYRVFEIE